MEKNQLFVKDLSDYEVWNTPHDILQVKETIPDSQRFTAFLAKMIEGKLVIWGFYGKTPYPETPVFRVR